VKAVNGRDAWALSFRIDQARSSAYACSGPIHIDLLGERMSALPAEIRLGASFLMPYKLVSRYYEMSGDEKKIGFCPS